MSIPVDRGNNSLTDTSDNTPNYALKYIFYKIVIKNQTGNGKDIRMK